MRFAQVGMLAYATATAAAPAFNFPNFGGGLFQFPSWPTKSNAPSAIPSSRASNPSISPPQPSAVPSASQIKPPPSSSSASPAQSSAAVVTTPTNCTPQGAAGGNTEDGIKNPYCCTDVTIVFARGTTESGNVGTVAGPPLFKSLRAKIGANRVTVQGTIYPATWDTINSGGGDGPTQMASDVKTILARCPATKIVLSGYSQGAMVAHNAFTKGGLAGSQAHAAVLFGDPYNGQGVGTLRSNVVKEFCATGDSVCDGSGSYAITQAHSTYGNNADEAATFIISALGL